MTVTQTNIQSQYQIPLGVDAEGNQLNLLPGRSTGLGRAVVSIKKGSVGITSTSVENPLINGFIIGGFKSLTNNVAVNLMSINIINNTSSTGILNYTIEVFDGVNLQVETGTLLYQIVNKAGVFTKNLITNFDFSGPTSTAQITTAGSLTVTFALSSANPSLLSVNANTSLTPSAGRLRINYSVLNLGNQEITLL